MYYQTFTNAYELNRVSLETRERNLTLRVEKEVREILRLCNIAANNGKLSVITPNKYHTQTLRDLQHRGFMVEKVRIGDIRVRWG